MKYKFAVIEILMMRVLFENGGTTFSPKHQQQLRSMSNSSSLLTTERLPPTPSSSKQNPPPHLLLPRHERFIQYHEDGQEVSQVLVLQPVCRLSCGRFGFLVRCQIPVRRPRNFIVSATSLRETIPKNRLHKRYSREFTGSA